MSLRKLRGGEEEAQLPRTIESSTIRTNHRFDLSYSSSPPAGSRTHPRLYFTMSGLWSRGGAQWRNTLSGLHLWRRL